jgi:hypothetical protein
MVQVAAEAAADNLEEQAVPPEVVTMVASRVPTVQI